MAETLKYWVYILQSQKHKRFYVGSTSNIQGRLTRHNSGLNISTKSGVPWVIVHDESFEKREDAYKSERQIKSYKRGNAFKKLINRGEVA